MNEVKSNACLAFSARSSKGVAAGEAIYMNLVSKD